MFDFVRSCSDLTSEKLCEGAINLQIRWFVQVIKTKSLYNNTYRLIPEKGQDQLILHRNPFLYILTNRPGVVCQQSDCHNLSYLIAQKT